MSVCWLDGLQGSFRLLVDSKPHVCVCLVGEAEGVEEAEGEEAEGVGEAEGEEAEGEGAEGAAAECAQSDTELFKLPFNRPRQPAVH